MDPRRPDKQQKYKPPAQNNNAAPGEDLTPDYMNILDSSRKRSFHKCSERFKVVKIESTEPFKRGRWRCMDFLDQSYDRIVHYNSVMYKTSETNLNQSISSENWDSDNMLQIFQQQNIIMADESKDSLSIKDKYIRNKHGNYVLLPGMVSSSLIGIKYPFELNFLPVTTDHNLAVNISESDIKSLNSNSKAIKGYLNLVAPCSEDQVCEQIIICQNDTKQINLECKMSTANVHYISNNEIKSENHINNNPPINHELYNCNASNIPQNLNVMPSMAQVGNNHSIDPNIQHKEIIDNNLKQNVINPNNNIPTNAVYQQQMYTNEVKQEYKNNPNAHNINPNQEQYNIKHNQDNFINVNQSEQYQNITPQEQYKNVIVPDMKMCNVQNINHNYSNDKKNLQYQPGTNEVKPQILKKTNGQNNMSQNKLTFQTHTYDVVPELNLNQNIYNNSHFNKSIHHGRRGNDEIKYSNLQQEIHNPYFCQNHYSDISTHNINNHKTNSMCHSGRQMFINEQVPYHQNKTDFSYPKMEEKKNVPKDDISPLSRPMSAKGIQDDQKSKYSNFTAHHFSFTPEIGMENSQTSVNYGNTSPLNTENGTVFLDQSQLFMPVYSFEQSYMQNMCLPIYSNAVQFPVEQNNICESEITIHRKPIGYQRMVVPQNPVVKRANQFCCQNQAKATDSLAFDSYSPNIESSPRSESSLDVKIEALMDLVKKHIKFAIIEDIHSLKQKIILLKERVAQLEFENEMLKSNVEDFKKIKEKIAG